ncbi:methionyl-tRNA synthetase [Coriobacterium glomerans PW2]|uniref:Methionyl-tRNA synthetase n=1 Tax=Coriobacterium glomerans (strain ATCC 49209 / DSM 20642 / JCM 10262 / PW2) TaxID=700015 RepID=F2N876_CORGP|nr:class I tRNA ligase family protein [Coriobacterium glomerans]AEB07259.1 methionyl-tRNA synthetase [Coriobacterium glomerans PW2]
MAHKRTDSERPRWPRRAVVTAGMPYGNKGLHFGHIGGVFVPADFYARFLRDRLGEDNVLFVSGTDCYGSPIQESYRLLREQGRAPATIADYVAENHRDQAATLDRFGISCDLYGGSALPPARDVHESATAAVIERLHACGSLFKRATKQFFDDGAQTFLNGRQVIGRCPLAGCRSERAYADECDAGHQFEPEELIAPRSTLTGEEPRLVPVDNLYFDLPGRLELLRERSALLAEDRTTRPLVTKTVAEWLLPPQIHIQTKFREAFDAIADELPDHTVAEAQQGKSSFTVTFPSWRERDAAHGVLRRGGVRFRSGKALVPFRITGNISWGVPAPTIEGLSGLTCWCWPESLWAPISFTRATLAAARERGEATRYASQDWRDWWCTDDARIYQFIGQDNIFFYSVAQPAIWSALGWGLTQSTVVANCHLLYMGKKASSSSATPPPLADDLLEHYTVEQLRAHWLSLGLGEKPVSFSPKAYDERQTGTNPEGDPLIARDDPRVVDPVLKEGALLTGVFNRLARSCFYGAAKQGTTLDGGVREAGCIPAGEPAGEVLAAAQHAIIAFERNMYLTELHRALGVCDEYLRAANKRWSDASAAARRGGDAPAFERALIDAFFELRCATVLMHGIVPQGCELICSHFDIEAKVFFSWEHIFDTTDELIARIGEAPGTHRVRPLPPRYDFFTQHPNRS